MAPLKKKEKSSVDPWVQSTACAKAPVLCVTEIYYNELFKSLRKKKKIKRERERKRERKQRERWRTRTRRASVTDGVDKKSAGEKK